MRSFSGPGEGGSQGRLKLLLEPAYERTHTAWTFPGDPRVPPPSTLLSFPASLSSRHGGFGPLSTSSFWNRAWQKLHLPWEAFASV